MPFKETSTGYLINQIARLYANLLNHKLKKLGISTAHFPILLELWEEEGLTQNDLVKASDLAQATIVNTLSRMERDGLIVRVADLNDGRVKRIMLTDKTRTMKEEAIALATQVNHESLATLTDTEKQQFNSLITKVIKRQKQILE